MMSDMMAGMATALVPSNLLACIIGVTLGNLIGVLPGLGPLAAMSILLPLTYGMDPGAALMMMGGIWYGAAYGGAITAILINIPGTAMASVTAIDGFPMTQAGRPGPALLLAALGSFFGGILGIVATMIAVPVLSVHMPILSPAESAALLIVCLLAGASVGGAGLARGAMMVSLGAMAGIVGSDPMSGDARLTFGLVALEDGISLSALVIGLFGLSEIIQRVGKPHVVLKKAPTRLAEMRLNKAERTALWGASLRGGGIGAVLGLLPGLGPTLASYLAYSVEQRRGTKGLGQGAPEGIVSPEAANNASDQTSFIPTLLLGVPGSGAMAIILVVLMIHGLNPGPAFLADNGPLFWSLIGSFWVGNVVLLILNVPLIRIWTTLLRIPPAVLYPATLVLMCVGTVATGQVSDLFVLAAAGVVAAVLQGAGFPLPPVLLGYILGPILEGHLIRAALIARGDPAWLLVNPGALAILLAGLLLALVFRKRGQGLTKDA